MDLPVLPSFTEEEIEQEVVIACGGKRLHQDASRVSDKSADFLIGNSVVELKLLNADEAITHPKVQRVMAELFGNMIPGCPTAVIDRSLLDDIGRSTYDNVFGQAIKSHVKKAKAQLRNSARITGASCSVLWIVNNTCSMLDHDSVQRLALKFIKNDTSGKEPGVDVVVVSGHYMLSDGFDHRVKYPIDCIRIRDSAVFSEFDALRKSWNSAVERRMVNVIRGNFQYEGDPSGAKKSIGDLSFHMDGVTYVKPAPGMNGKSDFFGKRRPRKPSRFNCSPGPEFTVYAGISREDWADFRSRNVSSVYHPTYEEWSKAEVSVRARKRDLPLVVVPITYAGWASWIGSADDTKGGDVHQYASKVFFDKAQEVSDLALEFNENLVLPSRFLYLVTREIGQDASFDVSSLFEVSFFGTPDECAVEVWINQRIDFQEGIMRASVHAIRCGVECLFWERDTEYCWT